MTDAPSALGMTRRAALLLADSRLKCLAALLIAVTLQACGSKVIVGNDDNHDGIPDPRPSDSYEPETKPLLITATGGEVQDNSCYATQAKSLKASFAYASEKDQTLILRLLDSKAKSCGLGKLSISYQWAEQAADKDQTRASSESTSVGEPIAVTPLTPFLAKAGHKYLLTVAMGSSWRCEKLGFRLEVTEAHQ